VTRPRSRVQRALAVVAIGLATGVLTLLGQSVLGEEANRLANSGAVWLAVASGVGALMASDVEAAIAGTVALLLALAGYQVAAGIASTGVSTSSLVIWSGTALVGGPVFGLAGHRWRGGPGRDRQVASALLGAVFVAEGAFTLLAIPRLSRTGWLEIAVGVALTTVLAGGGTGRIRAPALLLPLSLLGLLAYLAIDRAFPAA
jgi:hypothetical protein